MRSTWILLTLGLAACHGGDSEARQAPDPFAGTWACTGIQTLDFAFEGGTMASETSYTAETVAIVDDGDGTQTATFMTDAGATCARKSTVAGNTATLLSGQSCTFDGLTYAYTSEAATLSAGSYTTNSTFAISGAIVTLSEGGAPQMINVTGNGLAQSTCDEE